MPQTQLCSEVRRESLTHPVHPAVCQGSNQTTFRTAVCGRFRLAEDQYRRFIFHRCLSLHARLLLPLLKRCRPHLFDEDFQMIEALGGTKNWQQFRWKITLYQDYMINDVFLRGPLRLRVSARKLHALADELDFPG